MAPDPTTAASVKPQPKWPRYLFMTCLLLAAAPIFAKIFGYDFLPSPEWFDLAWRPALAISTLSGLAILWLVVRNRHRLAGGRIKKALAILMSPVFGFLMGYLIIIITAPMLLAAVGGQSTELVLTVERADREGSRRCRHAIEFEHMPFMFDRLCNIPDGFRKSLGPGDHLAIIGHGTAHGLFAERLLRVE